MKKKYVKIEGIHCGHCEFKIRTSLMKNKNIKDVSFNSNIACIEYENEIDNSFIIKTINNLDYITKDDYIKEDANKLKDNIKLKEFIIIVFSILLFVFIINKVFGFNIFNMIPSIDSNLTYGMLLLTGMLTSIHCVSMCGAINLVAVIGNDNKKDFRRPIFYNLGRIISYTITGAIVGFIGSIVSINFTISGIVILISSILMLTMSLNMLGVIKIKRDDFKENGKTRKSIIIGLLNGLMPCGPLQAMQIYALATGSALKGAISMFLFGLGTVPLMLLTGIIVNLANGKRKIFINKVASVLILILSLIMFNRALLTLNIDVFKMLNNYDSFTSSKIIDDYQEVEFDLTYDSYEDIIIQKDIPVKLIINVDKKYLTGCNNKIFINEYGITKKLEIGKNIIEFTPTKTGVYKYSCYMNMIKNNIKVIDDKSYFEKGKINE